MTRNRKYWDIIDQLYWWPTYIGLRSIGQKNWKVENDWISVPRSLVNPHGPLYSRRLKANELVDDLHSKEEILNHIFDLTFAIAPDALIEAAFVEPLGFSDTGPIESLGREVQARYGWGHDVNVTQHDGFFVSERSAVAVELKLSSASWPEQILKYAALLAWEEIATGRKENLGLLFVIPEGAMAKHWAKCGLTDNNVGPDFLDRAWTKPIPSTLSRFLVERREDVLGVLSRLRMQVITWAQVRDRLVSYRSGLEGSSPGDQCLQRLIDGFLAQLAAHRGTGL